MNQNQPVIRVNEIRLCVRDRWHPEVIDFTAEARLSLEQAKHLLVHSPGGERLLIRHPLLSRELEGHVKDYHQFWPGEYVIARIEGIVRLNNQEREALNEDRT